MPFFNAIQSNSFVGFKKKRSGAVRDRYTADFLVIAGGSGGYRGVVNQFDGGGGDAGGYRTSTGGNGTMTNATNLVTVSSSRANHT